ncbi:hypothetical protein K7432_007694 [Basidiobolus ranarum]|uniref:Uncharacterized protein n=1 Tax=Basidiobolus ranarum TaxID=34480 RepID=A0ABR2VZY9_9FUNG
MELLAINCKELDLPLRFFQVIDTSIWAKELGLPVKEIEESSEDPYYSNEFGGCLSMVKVYRAFKRRAVHLGYPRGSTTCETVSIKLTIAYTVTIPKRVRGMTNTTGCSIYLITR